jgi:hypothetical protein
MMTRRRVDAKRRDNATIHPTMTPRRVDAKRRADAMIHRLVRLTIRLITTRRFGTRGKAAALEVVVALAIMINLGTGEMINLGRVGFDFPPAPPVPPRGPSHQIAMSSGMKALFAAVDNTAAESIFER